ncbi:MAG: hypothetical protein H7Y17_16030 [Chlorobia bacterium]|nr:hypothetical protein [Fimbriimonadaceae bacterium]
MSEIPPVPEPGPTPPPEGYVAYPRGPQATTYGSADQLQALVEGYYGLNYVFILNVVLAMGGRLVGLSVDSPQGALAMLAGYFIVLFVVVGACSFPYNRKIAFGKGWGDGNAILASLLTALFSWLCCGIFGYIVMQQIAMSEMKKYGLKAGLGLRKKDAMALVEQLRAQESTTRTGQQSGNPTF